ncbi:hypothetical protein SARC_09484 [Sphaeroforma arctica JP610]|uniref:Uncharacterized protein n=1 Tax=Sphaeroforma arctica JP610 TaxID=667725 RepID=A0A0L0FQ25_9EUKA|nr:hypothetical protein SARC_09484 [Sphaeroforma arctica JP610]KNC78063.1 hypothetical protein SARC_09484 [Sphaeroforma arctica JP610]|eukprot:XP_014151965.1 hypothetical protein SARC_09484 [Sphaeroforma arctica JP610]
MSSFVTNRAKNMVSALLEKHASNNPSNTWKHALNCLSRDRELLSESQVTTEPAREQESANDSTFGSDVSFYASHSDAADTDRESDLAAIVSDANTIASQQTLPVDTTAD